MPSPSLSIPFLYLIRAPAVKSVAGLRLLLRLCDLEFPGRCHLFFAIIMSSTNYTMPGHVIESQQGSLVGMQIFLLSIALIFCSLRIFSRFMIVQSLGIDDYLMVAAAVCQYLFRFSIRFKLIVICNRFPQLA